MESSSKTAANILIVCAILLIGTSLVTVFNKKPEAVKVATVATTTPIQQDSTLENVSTSTPDVSTTTEATASSTSVTATTTATTTKSLTSKGWTWTKTTLGSKTTLPKKTTAFTITFNTDGSLKGTTDCNPYSGSYKVASNTLSFGMFDFSKQLCEEAQNEEFMTALREVKSFLVDTSNNLILSTASGSMIFK